MYHAEFWQKCFPELFPYGDGVFGLRRASPLTFREWAAYLLERVELEYDVPVPAEESEPTLQALAVAGEQADGGERETGVFHGVGAATASPGSSQTGGIDPVGGVTGGTTDRPGSTQTGGIDPVRCVTGGTESFCAAQYQPPAIARWRGDFNFIAVANDSWKRMELVRCASSYVRRRSFKQSLKTVLDCTSEKLSDAVRLLGEKANMVDVFRSSNVHADIKNALLDLHHFSSEIVGSDGARQQLRHEQSGAMLLRGGIDGFLTPNVADVRNPLMVVLHAGCVVHPDGGLDANGEAEKFDVSLLDEDRGVGEAKWSGACCCCPHHGLLGQEPKMPSAKKMLELVAMNPVAQAQFFIVSMQLFLEHVLGIMPFDEQLRANGARGGCVWSDGVAATFMGGSFPAIYQLHGPIEEQARLSLHPHIVLHFVNRPSWRWLTSILRLETDEVRSCREDHHRFYMYVCFGYIMDPGLLRVADIGHMRLEVHLEAGDLRGNGLNMTLCAAGPSTTGRLAGGNFAGRGEYYVVLCFFVAFAVAGES